MKKTKRKLLTSLGIMLAVLAISVQSASAHYEFFKEVYGPTEVPIRTYAEWMFQIHIAIPPGGFQSVVVTDKLPAELEVDESSFSLLMACCPPPVSPPPGTVTVERVSKGKSGAKLMTWTIDQLGLEDNWSYYILKFKVYTRSNPKGKWVGFTTPGEYLINYGAQISYFFMGTQYFDGPTPEVWITVTGFDD